MDCPNCGKNLSVRKKVVELYSINIDHGHYYICEDDGPCGYSVLEEHLYCRSCKITAEIEHYTDEHNNDCIKIKINATEETEE